MPRHPRIRGTAENRSVGGSIPPLGTIISLDKSNSYDFSRARAREHIFALGVTGVLEPVKLNEAGWCGVKRFVLQPTVTRRAGVAVGAK